MQACALLSEVRSWVCEKIDTTSYGDSTTTKVGRHVGRVSRPLLLLFVCTAVQSQRFVGQQQSMGARKRFFSKELKLPRLFFALLVLGRVVYPVSDSNTAATATLQRQQHWPIVHGMSPLHWALAEIRGYQASQALMSRRVRHAGSQPDAFTHLLPRHRRNAVQMTVAIPTVLGDNTHSCSHSSSPTRIHSTHRAALSLCLPRCTLSHAHPHSLSHQNRNKKRTRGSAFSGELARPDYRVFGAWGVCLSTMICSSTTRDTRASERQREGGNGGDRAATHSNRRNRSVSFCIATTASG